MSNQKFFDKVNSRLNVVKEKLIASDDVVKDRLDICMSCEYLITYTNQCKKCGCFINLKTKIKNAKCPIDKW